ncbi:MAG: enoyl-CoA hydratase/isomerase family protein [Bdellovibrionales bacterium]|nr:enoyl-CoA hydratase/isomerase family protein [Bdellovibrionales bacterium]
MSFYLKKFNDLEVVVKNNHQLWVTLNNPDQMNAITTEMINSLTEVLAHADFDINIRVVVITGKGKNFCAGGDIKAMEEKSGMFAGESNELRSRYQQGIQRIPKCIEDMSVPVIALVNGAAVGAGCDLSMMCDLRVGGNKTKFAETFTRMGLVPGDGGTFFLQRVVGYAKAMQMFLTTKSFEGVEALNFGLMNFLFEDSILEEETLRLADLVASQAPVAQRLTKKAMKVSYMNDLQTSLDMLASFQGISQRTSDHFEALKSFKEKRSPNFQGQ